MANQVDALYIYLLLVAGVMTALIFLAVMVLAIKYRRSRRPRSPADRGLPRSSKSPGRPFRFL
jgi:heme/copper-type cytochrome/quinol oxidase subunit 2